MDSSYFLNLIANGKVQSAARYFEAGTYLVEVDNCKMFQNRLQRPRAAVDCTVIDSSNVDFPETSQVTMVVALDSDSGPDQLKTFVCDILACKSSEVTSEVLSKIFVMEDSRDASLAVGLKAIVNAYDKPTKSGKLFTKITWKRFKDSDEKPNFKEMRENQNKKGQVAEATHQSENVMTDSASAGHIPF